MDSHSTDKVLRDLEKRYGSPIVNLRTEEILSGGASVPTVSTGILSLDRIMGGGLPVGRVVEVYAPEGTGKTTLCLQIAAEVIRKGGKVLYVDMEHKMDIRYAATLGVDFNKVYFTQPDYAEGGLNVVEKMAEMDLISLAIVDSVAALVPKAELEGNIGDQLPGLQARLMSQSLRKMKGTLLNHGVTVIFINQLRHKMGGMASFHGPSKTTSGGVALKYYTSIRMTLRVVKRLKEKEVPVGQNVKVEVTKSSIGPPYRSAILRLDYGSGFNKYDDIMTICLHSGMIEQAGAWYTYKDQKFQGRTAFIEAMKEDQELYDELYDTAAKITGVKVNEDTDAGTGESEDSDL